MSVAEWIDVTRVLSADAPVWPGAPPVALERRLSMDRGDSVNDSNLAYNVHAGTHVDAPCHVIRGAAGADALPVSALLGPAVVLDARETDAISAEWLSTRVAAADVRILLRTRASDWWQAGDRTFRQDFTALRLDAAVWLAARRTKLVGIDSMSIQRFGDPVDTHRVLLAAGVVVVEGLDLSAAPPASYELACLPIPLKDSDGAPVRALLRPLSRPGDGPA